MSILLKSQSLSLTLILFLISILTPLTLCDQTFTFNISDLLTIPYLQKVDISNSLAASSYQYIQQGQISVIQNTTQILLNNTNTPVLYNIIYFNLSNETGNQCYYQYFSNGVMPSFATIYDCTETEISQDSGLTCANYTSCSSQNFTYYTDLAAILYKQNVIMIQNNHPSNINSTPLYLYTQTILQVYNSNTWFYASVALTCCLLLSLVLLTGVVLYWSLKYRKAQRQLQQMRLTEVDGQAVGGGINGGNSGSGGRKSSMKRRSLIQGGGGAMGKDQ